MYEDENILLLNKPEGLLCHADGETYGDTLGSAGWRGCLFEKGEYDPKKEQSFAPALANRIDRNTGGMVIAAKNAEALRILNRKIKDRELSKGYLCLVHGLPEPREATLGGVSLERMPNKIGSMSIPNPPDRGPKPLSPDTACSAPGTGFLCSTSIC